MSDDYTTIRIRRADVARLNVIRLEIQAMRKSDCALADALAWVLDELPEANAAVAFLNNRLAAAIRAQETAEAEVARLRDAMQAIYDSGSIRDAERIAAKFKDQPA